MKIGKGGYIEALDFGVLLIHHLIDSTTLCLCKRTIFGAIYALIGSQHLKPHYIWHQGQYLLVEDMEPKGNGIS